MRVKSGKQLCYGLQSVQNINSLFSHTLFVCSCYFNVVNEDPILHSLLTYTTSVKELPCLKRSCDRFELKQRDWAVSHTLQTNYSLVFHHVPQNLETKIFTLTVKRSFYTSPHAKVCFLLEVTIY